MHSKSGVLAGMLPTRHSDMGLHCSWVGPLHYNIFLFSLYHDYSIKYYLYWAFNTTSVSKLVSANGIFIILNSKQYGPRLGQTGHQA